MGQYLVTINIFRARYAKQMLTVKKGKLEPQSNFHSRQTYSCVPNTTEAVFQEK